MEEDILKKFCYKKDTHFCKFDALVAGGQPGDAERGIYQCGCGIRWEKVEEYSKELIDDDIFLDSDIDLLLDLGAKCLKNRGYTAVIERLRRAGIIAGD